MSYIGNTNTTQGFIPAIDYFSGNGSTTAFTLSRPVASVAQVQVTIDNVAQNPSSAFTVSANTITFTSAPLSGTNNIYVYYTSPITQVIAPGQGTVNTTSLAGGTVTTTADASINGQTVGKGGGNVATNTAHGVSALNSNTSGGGNTALGYQAGYSNQTQSNTTAIGYQAGYTNTGDNELVAVGYKALFAATTGTSNTAVGHNCGSAITTGTNNTVLGSAALQGVTTASYNTAIGRQALNASTASNNTAIGYQAGLAATSGGQNTFVGTYAGKSSTTTGYIAILGYGAGENNTASYNTMVGAQAGATNTSGAGMVAIGSQALYANTTGHRNIAIGGYDSDGGIDAALRSNTTGSSNVAVGTGAFRANTTGTGGVAIGYQALYSNTTPGGNTAIGYQAVANGNGGNVTAVGYQAGIGSTCDNAAYFGYQAGNNATGGNGAVAIGPKTQFGSASPINEVVLGVNAGATVTGKGNSSFFVIAGGGGYYNGANQTSWNTTSDRRIKKNIVDNNDGLNKITGIRVRNFEYRLPEEIDELPPEQAVQKTGVQLGIIAQELQEVLPDCITEMSTGVLTVQTDNLTWYMVNAIKDLKAINDTQAETINALTARIVALENR